MMYPQEMIERLNENRYIFVSLMATFTYEQAGWRPSDGKWSALEVVNHLHDEEREDFRARLQSVLEDPAREWQPIEPEQWVSERNYNERDLEESLTNFLAERVRSVQWLKRLPSPDWDVAHDHPVAGPITARQLLANWLAHDYLHIRQLTTLNYQYLTRSVSPLSLQYAGD